MKDLFKVESNPQLDKYNFTFSNTSKYPYFTRTVFNNGIYGYVDYYDDVHLIKGNAIAVGMMGMQFFYMKSDFYAGQFTKTLYPLFKDFDEDIALYFISILNLYQNRLKGELVRNFESYLLSQKVLLPTIHNNLDFDFMRSYIAAMKAERIIMLKEYLQVSGLKDTILTDDEKYALDGLRSNRIKWGKFDICGNNGVFEVFNTHSILKTQVVAGSGNVPYVGAGESNNSVQAYISYDMSQIEKGNSIMIGGKTLVITYQEEDYFSNDSHNLALYYKDEANLNRNVQLFLVSALYRSLKPKYHWGDSISNKKIKHDSIMLPIDMNGKVDYIFINNLVSAQIKLCIDGLMSAKDLEIGTNERVINNKFDKDSYSCIIDNASKYQRFITHLPYYPSIKAACHDLSEIGAPDEDVKWIDVSDELPHLDKSIFVVRAMGNSMQPKINDGDYCVFSSYTGGSREGEIVLVEGYNIKDYDSDNIACTIKKYHSEKRVTEDGWEHGSIELIPLNKEYESFILNPEDSYRILGVLKTVIPKSIENNVTPME